MLSAVESLFEIAKQTQPCALNFVFIFRSPNFHLYCAILPNFNETFCLPY